MWLSGQQKQPADNGEGQTGFVTMNGSGLAVMLDSERRGLELYSPGGYHWTPMVGQRVLVIQGKGEIPCVVGTRDDSGPPDRVSIQAKALSLSGESIGAAARNSVTLQGNRVNLRGVVYVNGERLEDLIKRIAMSALGGGGGA